MPIGSQAGKLRAQGLSTRSSMQASKSDTMRLHGKVMRMAVTQVAWSAGAMTMKFESQSGRCPYPPRRSASQSQILPHSSSVSAAIIRLGSTGAWLTATWAPESPMLPSPIRIEVRMAGGDRGLLHPAVSAARTPGATHIGVGLRVILEGLNDRARIGHVT